MLKKLRLPLEVGEKAYFVTPMNKPGDVLPYVVLESYSVKDGRIEWLMKTDKGQFINGRIRDQQPNPLYKDASITLAIPVTLHAKSRGLAPDFIFAVPSMVNIQKTPFQRRSKQS